ncbi:MAG: preprotein translocase subunit SecE [Gammaproteobacteria bacterium]|nr:preprotein translocase subunit SecE [Gammaproteobacteria bacterium]
MNAKVNGKGDTPPEDRLDTIKWLAVWLLTGAGLAGFYSFSEYSLLLRVISLLVLLGAAVFIASRTEKGRGAWGFTRDAQLEVRKVVWPTRRETMQVTGIVLVMVMVMALMIWAVDGILMWIVQRLTG